MGLDTVELVMAIEEEFGVDIPNEDAERMTTVGEIYEWLKLHIASTPPMACLTQRVFYKLRRVLIENYRLERHSIVLGTRLTDLLPLDFVEDGWPFLQMFIDLETPPFKVANEMLGNRLNRQTQTMGDLVDCLIIANGNAMAPQQESETEIWHRLVSAIVREANVSPAEIRPETSLTRDLGMD